MSLVEAIIDYSLCPALITKENHQLLGDRVRDKSAGLGAPSITNVNRVKKLVIEASRLLTYSITSFLTRLGLFILYYVFSVSRGISAQTGFHRMS